MPGFSPRSHAPRGNASLGRSASRLAPTVTQSVRTCVPTRSVGTRGRELLLAISLVIALAPQASADEQDRLKVGVQPDGRIVVPTNQILKPAGKQVTFPGRPVDLLLIDDGKTLVAKNMRDLVFIDPATGAIKQTLALPAAADGLSAAFSAVGL